MSPAALVVAAWRGGPALDHAIVALALVVFVPAFARVAPSLDQLWLSRAAAAMVRASPAGGAPVVAVGYSEPSLVFLLGTATRFLAPDAAAAVHHRHARRRGAGERPRRCGFPTGARAPAAGNRARWSASTASITRTASAWRLTLYSRACRDERATSMASASGRAIPSS